MVAHPNKIVKVRRAKKCCCVVACSYPDTLVGPPASSVSPHCWCTGASMGNRINVPQQAHQARVDLHIRSIDPVPSAKVPLGFQPSAKGTWARDPAAPRAAQGRALGGRGKNLGSMNQAGKSVRGSGKHVVHSCQTCAGSQVMAIPCLPLHILLELQECRCVEDVGLGGSRDVNARYNSCSIRGRPSCESRSPLEQKRSRKVTPS
jgi:hypothetical protein